MTHIVKLPQFNRTKLIEFFDENSQLEENPYAPNARCFYRPPLGEVLMRELKPLIEIILGESLYCCSSFMREHMHGSELKAHYDRRGMEFTVSITLEQDYPEWGLEVYEGGEWVQHLPSETHGALMNGTRCPHRRIPYPGEKAIVLTVSYTRMKEFAEDAAGSQAPRHIVVPNFLTPSQISRVYREFDSSSLSPGFRSENDIQTQEQTNLIASFEMPWLSEMMLEKARWVNDLGWKMSLGAAEPLQFTRYEGGHYYPWHTDTIDSAPRFRDRVLSMSLILRDARAGGGLEVEGDSVVEVQEGGLVLFPSTISHRALRVLRGTRDSVVMWVKR